MRKIAFLGAGSIAEALISGMIKKNIFKGEDIIIKNKSNKQRLETLKKKYGIITVETAEELLNDISLLLITVKPKDINQALESIRPYLSDHVTIVSVAAGVSISTIQQMLNKANPIIRTMPNTSSKVHESITAMSYNSNVSDEQVMFVRRLFDTVGKTYIVDEKHLDAITALSGSGPAYIYYFTEAMLQAAMKIGLDEKLSKTFIVQTLKGAVKMIEATDKTCEQLRKDVTSPGGTTEAGINKLNDYNVQKAIIECIVAAKERSIQIGKQFENTFVKSK